jgi:zinc protease
MGMSIEDVDAWPDRLRKVTVQDIKAAAQKYLVDKNSVAGFLLPTPEFTSSVGDAPAPVRAQMPAAGKS